MRIRGGVVNGGIKNNSEKIARFRDGRPPQFMDLLPEKSECELESRHLRNRCQRKSQLRNQNQPLANIVFSYLNVAKWPRLCQNACLDIIGSRY